jgi:hypothetical protein
MAVVQAGVKIPITLKAPNERYRLFSTIVASRGSFAVPWLFMFSAPFRLGLLMLLCFATGCTNKPKENVDLHTRITAASSSHYCHSPNGCFNPHILVVEKGYFVTIFPGNRPQSTAVSPEDLGEFLIALPISAWPLGPIVGITPSDDVIDSQAIQTNLDQAQRTCRSLGLDIQFRPGG